MTVALRPAQETDVEQVASLMIELGYPSTAASVKVRLDRAPQSVTSRCLVAQDTGEVVGLMSAELIPYFPDRDDRLPRDQSCRHLAEPPPRRR